MASAKTLASYTRKELAQLAKHNQVEGWHGMKKAELIDALKGRQLTKVPPKKSLAERSRALRAQASESPRAALRRTAAAEAPSPARDNAKPAGSRPIRLFANAPKGQREMIAAQPQGSYWIYANWLLTREVLSRAEASLGTSWHAAVPVLKVFDLTYDEETSPTKCCIARIPIHSPIDHWYVPVADPSRTYQLQLGYEAPRGQFFMLARSSAVKLPLPGTTQARKYDEHRQDSSGELSSPEFNSRFPVRGSAAFRFAEEDVSLEIQADVMIVGQVSPDARLTCREDPVPAQADGRFEVRLMLEEGRQVIPLEAISADGSQSRTVILALERNTKTLEPQSLNEWD